LEACIFAAKEVGRKSGTVQRTFCTAAYGDEKPSCDTRTLIKILQSNKNIDKSNNNKSKLLGSKQEQYQVRDDEGEEGWVVLVEEGKIVAGKERRIINTRRSSVINRTGRIVSRRGFID